MFSWTHKQRAKEMIKDYETRKGEARADSLMIIDQLVLCNHNDPWVLDMLIKYQIARAEVYLGAWGEQEGEGEMYDLHRLYLLKGDIKNAIAALARSADMCESIAKKHHKRIDKNHRNDRPDYDETMWKEYTEEAERRRNMAKKYPTMTKAELAEAKKEAIDWLEGEKRVRTITILDVIRWPVRELMGLFRIIKQKPAPDVTPHR